MPLPSPFSPHSTVHAPCAGYCRRCRREHGLGQGNSRLHALALLAALEKKGGIDIDSADPTPINSLDYLYGPARGQMFGVLEFRSPDGSLGVLRAFSGQYNGQWQVPGWVPPLFTLDEWQQTSVATEPRIKDLGRRIQLLATDNPHRQHLVRQRRTLSRQLMEELHATYRLTNFRGETRTLAGAFLGPGGLPTGTGDCCAPKLLGYAARHRLLPLGISEFYLGRRNLSRTRAHGHFYSSCSTKCRPILGFLLCGLED